MWEKILSLIPVKEIINYLKRPRLEIYYDPNKTYHTAKDLSFQGVRGNFVHVMVRNNGRHTAKNCIGELGSIKEFKNGKFQDAPGYRNVMQLKWAHEKNFSPKDIDKDYPKRLDVCYVHEGYDILHFFTEKYPSGNQTDFPPGKYRIKIRAKCDNGETSEKEFIVKYEAKDFHSLRIEDV